MDSKVELRAREPRECSQRAAFTLVELVVIIGFVCLGLCLLAPALARTNISGRSLQCLNNLRQLIVTWDMYSQESRGRLVCNFHGGDAQGGNFPPSLGPGWVEGWLDWSLSPDNTNVALLVNPKYSRFAPYLRGATNLFKCPADQYLSQAQKARRWTQRVRSYSENLTIGQGNAQSGPWASLYRQITNVTDLIYPGPAETSVFLDEHPDSINDPGFFNPFPTSWVDVPGTYHDGAANFAFADGHVATHKWVGSLSRGRARAVVAIDGNYINLALSPGDPDIHWMSYHSCRVSTNSY